MDEKNISIGMFIGVAGGFTIVIAAAVIFVYLFRSKSKEQKQQQGHEAEDKQKQEEEEKEQTEQSVELSQYGGDSTSEFSDCCVEDKFPVPVLNRRNSGFLSSLFGRHKSLSLKIQRFSYRDLEKATESFTTLLAVGALGSVFKATFPSGEIFAVKVLNPLSERGEKEFQTEVMLLERLHHRNLVNLIGYSMDKQGHHSLIHEYMSNGSLSTLLHDKSREPLVWEERVNIAQDMSRGIEYLHKGARPPVIHRDIKAANILIDSTRTARVADFGLSKEAIYRSSGVRGTYGYVDPECVRTNTFNDKTDVYSFGVLLFELISAIGPQQGLLKYVEHASRREEDTKWIQLLDPRLQCNCNVEELKEMASLALQCIHEVPSKRPDMRDICLTLSSLRKRISTASIC